MNYAMLHRAALCAALLIPVVAKAAQGTASLIESPKVVIELHGINIGWNGEPLGGYASLEQRCHLVRSQVANVVFTIASGMDTSQVQVERIVKILRHECGVRHFVYDAMIPKWR